MKHALVCTLLLFNSNYIAALEVVFEHNPPFQMVDESGTGYGPVYFFAKKLLKAANLKGKFTAKPWARIMNIDAHRPNVMILSMSKTPQRANRFIWLTSVYTGQQYLWKIRSRAEPTNGVVNVAIERNSHKMKSVISYFREDNVLQVINSTQALQALIKGRVNRFVGTTFAVSGKLADLGYDISILERLNVFDEAGFESKGLYLTLTLNTQEKYVSAIQQALASSEIKRARHELFTGFVMAEKAILTEQ
ncbi:substrate-binding periplasmic protein [Pseudoalteromonas obscura]|uniref:Transporter substrate-binding domain-containing protein n=1 Tax=Pseudoalteromonas obscura TaxID=3048491 RepID=A0ABT7EFV1_9GAMM|nr:transporter substrate-binding domain-containing protein [Pseudoalteromonas sp. P94(2023)]MDK2593479.1 transporter substrate-binding domain-containing protein [Pseudoalteromonas sp. P94(2023)]